MCGAFAQEAIITADASLFLDMVAPKEVHGAVAAREVGGGGGHAYRWFTLLLAEGYLV